MTTAQFICHILKNINLTLIPFVSLNLVLQLKTICLRHHLPFNGSLLDKILDRFDPRGSGRVDWTEFIAFVERAMPLTSAGSPASTSYSKSRQNSSLDAVDVPPSQPSWETRQPLQALSKREQVIPKAAALQQDIMYDDHKKLLGEYIIKTISYYDSWKV